MKTFTYFTRVAIILFSLPFLFNACTKQVTEDDILQSTSAAITSNACKPVVFGVLVQQPPGVGESVWTTAMQKWYGSNGKPANIKASLRTADGSTGAAYLLEWGEVTYHNNNQVYVKNVPRNDTLMRVTIDEQQRPVASYFYYNDLPGFLADDTSYYYYTGNRLDSIIGTSSPYYNFDQRVFRKYIFTYDPYGNVVRIDIKQSFNSYAEYQGTHTSYLAYNYAQPVSGMLPAYMMDRPYRLLEYLDLLQLPIHHQLISVTPDPNFVLPVYPNPHEYTNYQLLDNGLVYSYEVSTSFARSIYYTGWECGTGTSAPDPANRQKTNITSLEDLQRLYPARGK